MKEDLTIIRAKKLFDNITGNPYALLAIVLTLFTISILSVIPLRFEEMIAGPAFIFVLIPLPVWASIVFITIIIFIMISHLDDVRYQFPIILSSIVLIIAIRMTFPITFTSIAAYEPDTIAYMNVVQHWVSTGIDFGPMGNYEHNYPLSFLTAFAFIKLGIPLNIFYRVAPFAIYISIIVILYFTIKEVSPSDKKLSIASISVFLFSFSSVAYWVTVHYCPDLFGALTFMLAFYFVIRYAKSEKWNNRLIIPLIVSIFLLILSHHLSTLYFIVTLAGFTFASWFFKPAVFKKGALVFLLLTILTYTTWFVYGTLVYPTFFNVYVYFSGFSSVGSQIAGGGIENNVLFLIYPIFILTLSLVAIVKMLNIHNFSFLRHIRAKVPALKVIGQENSLITFLSGFTFIGLLFGVGLGLPVLFGSRILEVLLIGLYPLASLTIDKLSGKTSSRRLRIILLIILLLVVIANIYRYNSQIQRRITV